jgi:uncharacterized protein
MDEPNASIRSWSWWWIAASTILLTLVYISAQVAALLAVAAFAAVTTPEFDAETWGTNAISNGLVLSAATFASAGVCIPLMRWLAGRREPSPWSFLGFRPVRWRDVVIACGAMGMFIAITDPLNVWLDRPLVPPFMLEAYATAGSRGLLFLAVTIAAPVTEELAFRGFLFGALRARGVRTGLVVGVTSSLFAVIHTQYDLWDMGVVLLMGLLFGIARARFDSVIPAMAMHGFANTVAFIETTLIART